MGLRSSKPKRSKDHTIKNSVKNKHEQQANKFREQTSDNRHSAKKTGKQNKKNKNKGKICQIKESAQVADESDTDNEDSTKIKTEESEAPIQDLYKLPKTKQKSDIGFQTKKKTNKNKICQNNESAQEAEESDTDNEDLTKVKTEETEAPIFPKIPITDLSPSRSEKPRGNYFDLHDFDHLSRILISHSPEPCVPHTRCGIISHTDTRLSRPYRCRSSDNNEEQISKMDKIIAQCFPCVPRRNRPAPPPPDVLD